MTKIVELGVDESLSIELMIQPQIDEFDLNLIVANRFRRQSLSFIIRSSLDLDSLTWRCFVFLSDSSFGTAAVLLPSLVRP